MSNKSKRKRERERKIMRDVLTGSLCVVEQQLDNLLRIVPKKLYCPLLKFNFLGWPIRL